MSDDAQLLRRYLSERAEEAFAELVRRHLNLVYFAALRQVNGDAHGAEDVTQRVFAKLAAKARSLSGRASLAGWLYLATRFEAAHTVRAEQRRRARELEAQTMSDLLSEPELPPDWDRLKPVIDEVLVALNAQERELVLLRFFQGVSFVEMGSRLALSPDACRFKLARVLEKLRGALAKRGLSSTSAAIGIALAGQAEAAAPVGLVASVTGSALVSSGASSLSLSGLLETMSLSKVFIGAAVLTGLITLSTARHEQVLAREEAAATLDVRREVTALNAQLAALRREDQAVQKEVLSARHAQSLSSRFYPRLDQGGASTKTN